MKKAAVFLAALLILTALTAMGQPLAGKKFEAGASLSFFSHKLDGSDQSTTYLTLPVRFGWFAWRGLEIEPEVQLAIPFGSGAQMTYFLLANVTYNFKIPGKLVPFVGVGAGFGNGFPLYYFVPPMERSSALGALGGVKYLVGGMALLRFEYRISRVSVAGGEERPLINQALAGLSILF